MEITHFELISETITDTVEATKCSNNIAIGCEEDELSTMKEGGCDFDLGLQMPVKLDRSLNSWCSSSVINDSTTRSIAISESSMVESGGSPISVDLPVPPAYDPKEPMFVENMIMDSRKHDYIPLWGFSSICGRRQEMEDAMVAIPFFSDIPLQMLLTKEELEVDPTSKAKLKTAHFFGVYDGHGGSQVADYCRERIHLALLEEIINLKGDVYNRFGDDHQKQWEMVFTNCFRKVDAEVGGNTDNLSKESGSVCSLNPVAPETVGSTAVVAVVCSSHIIVSNCGDSRAVLYRGKQAIPLSIDHKPNREDELARIESVGGRVIDWNGYRVSAVLAMSRSIGDRYLKPSIIPYPEVKFVPRIREDECLIIASDGLWDVMTNEEACDAARRRILLWHKKYGSTSSAERGTDAADPATQIAADHLIKLAQHKGSRDNITVIVVDLKGRRKFKTKT